MTTSVTILIAVTKVMAGAISTNENASVCEIIYWTGKPARSARIVNSCINSLIRKAMIHMPGANVLL